jgi:hypothetical protein
LERFFPALDQLAEAEEITPSPKNSGRKLRGRLSAVAFNPLLN